MKETVTISKTFTIEQFKEQQLDVIELPANARKIVNVGISANPRYSTPLRTYKLYYGVLDTGETDVLNLSSRDLEIADGKLTVNVVQASNVVYLAIPVEFGFPVMIIDDEKKTLSVATVMVQDADTSENRQYYLAQTVETGDAEELGMGNKTVFFKTE